MANPRFEALTRTLVPTTAATISGGRASGAGDPFGRRARRVGLWLGIVLVLLAAVVGTAAGPVAAGPAPWDADGSGAVDINDLVAIGRAWGRAGAPGEHPADTNEDGTVDVADLLAVSRQWGWAAIDPTPTFSPGLTPTIPPLATPTAFPSPPPGPTRTVGPTPVPEGTPSVMATRVPFPTPTPILAATFTPVATWTPEGPIAPVLSIMVVDPPTSRVSAGATFKVDVLQATSRSVQGTEFGLRFDPAVVQVERVEEGPFYRDWARANGAETIVVPAGWPVDNHAGTVGAAAIVILGGPSTGGASTGGPTGIGVVASVTLRAVAPGRSALTLTDASVAAVTESGRAFSFEAIAPPGEVIVGRAGDVTPLPTAPATPTVFRSPTPGATRTPSPNVTPTNEATWTATPQGTSIPAPTRTTDLQVAATAAPTWTPAPQFTATPGPTRTPTAEATPTGQATATPTMAATATVTATPTATPTTPPSATATAAPPVAASSTPPR